MSFWGMSQTGRDARGRLNEIPQWQWQQAQDWWGRSNQQMPTADYLQNQWISRLTDQYNEGFGDPSQIRQIGADIMPVEGTMGNIRQRNANTRQAFGSVPSAWDTSGRMDAVTDDQGRAIADAGDRSQATIDQGFGGMRQRADGFGRDIVRNIDDSFGAADTNSGNAFRDLQGTARSGFGRMQGNIDDAYGGMQGRADSSFSRQQQNVDRLNPNSEFRGARTSRAFAPAMASTAMRLRRGGVDMSGPEANAAFQRVEANRARAMDDTYADENTRFVNAQNNVLRDQLGTDLNLRGRQLDDTLNTSGRALNTEIGLGRDWEGVQRGLTLGRGDEFRGEMRRQQGVDTNLSAGQMDATLGNIGTDYNRMREYYGNRRNDAMTGRDLSLQDATIQRGLNEADDRTDLLGVDLGNQQYQQGVAQRGRELDTRNWAAGQAAQAGNTAWNRGVQANQIGGNYAQGAQQGFGGTLARESATAGWGSKMLAGLGSAALGAAIPGGGGFAGFGRQLANIGGGGGSSWGGGSMRTPPFNPNARRF